MTVYAMLIFYISFVALCYRYASGVAKKIMYLTACFLVFMLTAFRHISIGADTLTYCNYFIRVQQIAWNQIDQWTTQETGYVAFSKLLGKISVDPQMLIIAMAIVVLIPIFRWIWKNSQTPCMSLLVFICMGFWQQSSYVYRQWFAMVILLSSMKYIVERRLIPFCTVIFIAMQFHRTAIIFLPAYFVYKIKSEKWMMIIAVGMSLCLGVLTKPLLPLLSKFARIERDANSNGGWTLLIVLWCIVFFIYFGGRTRLREVDFRAEYIMVLSGAVLQPAALELSVLTRLVDYYSLHLILLLPNTVEYFTTKKGNRRLASLWDLLFLILMILWCFAIGGMGEYMFMWE